MKIAPAGVIAYTINGAAVKDRWKKIFVVFNGNAESKEISLPKGKWNIAVDTNNDVKISSGIISLQKYSAVVLYQ